MKILACTDGSEQSIKAMGKVLEIAEEKKKVEITVIHVMPMYQAFFTGYEISSEMVRQWDECRREESNKILDEAVKCFEAKNIQVNTLSKEGHPADTICNVASEMGCDLIVIGSRGLSGLKKWIPGSISNAVAQQCKTSVMIVK